MIFNNLECVKIYADIQYVYTSYLFMCPFFVLVVWLKKATEALLSTFGRVGVHQVRLINMLQFKCLTQPIIILYAHFLFLVFNKILIK